MSAATLHPLIFAALFLVLGWMARIYQERRKTPRKRTRALPKGTEAERKPRKPGRPRKDPAPKPMPLLPSDD